MDKIETKIRLPDDAERLAMIRQCAGDVRAFLQDVDSVMDRVPSEMGMGMIGGYLRGKGYTWDKAFAMMDDYMRFVTPKPISVRSNPRHQFKVEMVTCSVGCADFLDATLTRNMPHFDGTLVVTDANDKESQKVTEKHGASCLVTDLFYRKGERFNRGAAYNRALDLLQHRDWVAFVDADIVVKDGFRSLLNQAGLVNEVFYGCDRLNIKTERDRQAFISRLPHELHLDSTPEWGFGYFQLFNMASPFLRDKSPIYPSANTDGLSDYFFRAQFGSGHRRDEKEVWQWDSVHQVKLPWACYHLGTDGTKSLVRNGLPYD